MEKAVHLSRFERFEEWYFSKSKVWLWTGFGIIVLGLILGGIRDVNELTLGNLLLTGISSGTTYQGSITLETIVNHSTEQILLLAMSLFKLGIGGYIYTIVRQLEKTGIHAMEKLAPDAQKPSEPFFRKLFPRLLVIGTDVQLINVGVLMVIWDLNALNLLHLQFVGQTSGAAFNQATTIEGLMASLVTPVEMLGATLMLTGIPLGLASIVYNLRFQMRQLPAMLGTFMAKHLPAAPQRFPTDAHPSGSSSPRGLFPRKTLITTITAFAIGASGLAVIAPFRTVYLLQTLSLQFAGLTSSPSFVAGTLFESLAKVTVEKWELLALGLLIFSINLWLLHIINALEGTREVFSEILTSTTGTTISPVEKGLWPARLVRVLASIGLAVMITNFLFGLTIDSTIVTQTQLAGGTGSVAFRDAVLSGEVYSVLTAYLPFTSFGFLLSGVGFSLATIVINLRQTASTLLNVFPRVMKFVGSKGGRSEYADSVTLPISMSLAPWRLLTPIYAGAAIAILALFPFGILQMLSYIQYQALAFVGQTSAPSYASSFLAQRLWQHTLLPLKLFGMGVMLFGVGRTFGVIVGFVKARTVAIGEFVDSIVAMAAQVKTKSPGEQIA